MNEYTYLQNWLCAERAFYVTSNRIGLSSWYSAIITTVITTLIVICTTTIVQSQSSYDYETVITSVSVNGTALPESEIGNFYIAPNDIVVIRYACNGVPEGTVFQYETIFSTDDQKRSETRAENYMTLANMATGTYVFHVQALSLSRGWKASSSTIVFAVDKKRATKARFAALQPEKEITPVVVQEQSSSSPWWSVLWFIVATVVAIATGIGGYIVATNRMNKKVKKLEDDYQFAQVSFDQSSEIDKQNITTLQEEIATLRNDVVSLNQQITELQERAKKLTSQNNDLRLQVERLQQVQHDLELLQQQKDDLFTIMIHDIKNPASLIKNLVDLLRGYDVNSSEMQEIMEDIIVTTTKIVSLSQEFSQAMAMDSAHLKLEFMKEDISHLIHSVCRRNTVTADKKNIRIFVDMPDTIKPIEFDPNKIEEMLDNVLSNAIKFSYNDTFVSVRVIPNANDITIEVEDKGQGMSQEDIARAFVRGAKLSARPTAGEPSSGLGLWIVKQLVEAHNGTVWVKSTQGTGSTFGIVLPYTQPINSTLTPSPELHAMI